MFTRGSIAINGHIVTQDQIWVLVMNVVLLKSLSFCVALKRSPQMTVENNCAIVIPTLTDWFKTLSGFSTNEKQNQDQSQLLQSGDF